MSNDTDQEYEYEEVWAEIPKQVVYDIIFVVISLAIYLAYRTNVSFSEFIDLNILYIMDNYDLLLLAIIFVIIPYVWYWICIFGRIIRKLWVTFRLISVRLALKIFRSNIAIFGFSSVILALALDKPFLSEFVALPSFIIWIIINWAFLDYDALKEQEDELVALYKTQAKRVPEFSIFQIGSFILFIINFALLELKLPNGTTLKDSELSILSRIMSDIPLGILFWITFVFTFLWFFVSFFFGILIDFIMKRKDKINFYIQLIFFLAIIYIIAKIVIYNIIQGQTREVQTLYSVIITAISGLLLKKSKSIVGFFTNTKIGEE